VPPVAVTPLEYEVPCVPEGKLDVEMVKAGGAVAEALTESVAVLVAVLFVFPLPVVAVESVTLMPKE
jgi:hypothetical protein